jgi:FtsP/CotA-like multicopper oxidase with cupredoxin domain
LADLSQVLTTRRTFCSKLAAGNGALLAGCDVLRKVSGERATRIADAAERTVAPDVTLRIGSVLVDVAKDHTISTTGYNGSAPGPLIRLREGVPVTVEIVNQTHNSELVHWHGLTVQADVDGAEEENSVAKRRRTGAWSHPLPADSATFRDAFCAYA